MGNCFSSCVKRQNSASILTRNVSSKRINGIRFWKRCSDSKLPPRESLSDQLSTSTGPSPSGEQDLSVLGHAMPIHRAPIGLSLKPMVSGGRIIVVQPCRSNENDCEETFPGDATRKPVSKSESRVPLDDKKIDSLKSPSSSPSESSLETEELSEEGDRSSDVSRPPVCDNPAVPVQYNKQLELLKLLTLRLDMATNNIEINRLLGSIDYALERSARIREEAAQRWRLARDEAEAGMSNSRGKHGEEHECEDNNDEGRLTPPPPKPRICWQ